MRRCACGILEGARMLSSARSLGQEAQLCCNDKAGAFGGQFPVQACTWHVSLGAQASAMELSLLVARLSKCGKPFGSIFRRFSSFATPA